ncbi:MAG: GNAT family N-acetyltransferase [Acidimicrobiia bacterium]|nr:GNAT family N-acetyltransferase [Acidimicrobiia bacterium]
MSITTQPLTDEHLDDAIRFLRSANPFAEHTWGWETGRFLDWRWGGNILREPGFFARNGTVIRRSNEIAALVIAEGGAEDHCILTSTEDAELVDFGLTWLIDERGARPSIFLPSDEATWLHEVLAAHGFEKGDVAEVGWGFDVTQIGDLPTVPEAFVIDRVHGESDYPEIARCLEGAFGGEADRLAVLESLARNPGYRSDLNIVARTAGGRIASYCRGTVDVHSGLGSIDPVATHPDFQGNGIGRAVVLTCFAAQARLGGREIYIGSGPDGSAGSGLYSKLNPISKITYSAWSRSPA